MELMKPIVTIIGAASTTFGPKVLRDIVNHPQVDGCTFRFVDINAEHLAIYTRLARRINDKISHSVEIESTTDRRAALPGSDYVIISVEVDHYQLWAQDYAVPVEEGIHQVNGELGGPGGLFHSLRQIPLHLEIGRDIAELCPKAKVMICSNPLNRLCLAMRRHTGVGQIIGLCHGVEITENFLVSDVLKIDGADIESTAAGTNHFTWILDLRRKSTGEDLYPDLRMKLKALEPGRESLSRKLFEVYGYYPACGDTHVGEYVPYAWEFVDMSDRNFDGSVGRDLERWAYLDKLSRGEATDEDRARIDAVDHGAAVELRLDEFFSPRSWVDTLAFPLLAAVISNERHRLPALNMLNAGTIENLASDVFVEAPAMVDASGVHPIRIGALPKELAAFNRRDIDQTELTVEAAVTGDHRRLMQAVLLDPVVHSAAAAERTVNRLLKQQAKYLPQFA